MKAPLISALWKLRIGLLLLFGILWGTQRWLEKRRVKTLPAEQPQWREKSTQIVKAIFDRSKNSNGEGKGEPNRS